MIGYILLVVVFIGLVYWAATALAGDLDER